MKPILVIALLAVLVGALLSGQYAPDKISAAVDTSRQTAERVNAQAVRDQIVVPAQAQADAAAARIASLKVPTLILWGGRDALIPPDSAQRFARDIAGSKLVMFDDLGHVPHEEAPARTLAPVQAFIAR